jgi:hypothetical protein
MKMVANFWINETNVDEQHFKLIKNKTRWYGGRKTPPLDTPPCGFENELCQVSEETDSKLTFISLADRTVSKRPGTSYRMEVHYTEIQRQSKLDLMRKVCELPIVVIRVFLDITKIIGSVSGVLAVLLLLLLYNIYR